MEAAGYAILLVQIAPHYGQPATIREAQLRTLAKSGLKECGYGSYH